MKEKIKCIFWLPVIFSNRIKQVVVNVNKDRRKKNNQGINKANIKDEIQDGGKNTAEQEMCFRHHFLSLAKLLFPDVAPGISSQSLFFLTFSFSLQTSSRRYGRYKFSLAR